MCLREADKIKLSIAVWNDSLFLSSLGVMDYSLLVGIDDENHQLLLGIIGTHTLSHTHTQFCKVKKWQGQILLSSRQFLSQNFATPFLKTHKHRSNLFFRSHFLSLSFFFKRLYAKIYVGQTLGEVGQVLWYHGRQGQAAHGSLARPIQSPI